MNTFIDFDIIKKSNHKLLVKELDLLIYAQREIYIWSKINSTQDMEKYCNSIKIPVPENEKLEHEIVKLKRIKAVPYAEIAEFLKISIDRVSYYSNTDLFDHWLLSDWIKGYYIKDSTSYQKADYVIDPDVKFVNKFIASGRSGKVIEKIV